MAQKKSPDNKTTEELLEDLNNPTDSEEVIINEEDTILTFVRFYNLQPGLIKIKGKHLYSLYRKFTKEPKISKSFHEDISQYIPYMRDEKTERVYLINKKMLNLSEKALELIKKENKAPKHARVIYKLHFENFINKFDIKSGNDTSFVWASIKILYNLYDKWVYGIRKTRPLSKQEFREFCKVHFKHKETDDGYWFKLNDNILEHVTPEMDSGTKARNSLPNEKEEKPKK